MEVQRHLGGVDDPASGEQPAHAAESNGAPGEIVDALRGLGDEPLSGPDEVMRRLR
jgi:hypothetical protein